MKKIEIRFTSDKKILERINKSILKRIFGVLGGCILFFVITNFGVWSQGSYGYSLEGFLLCYTLALPFFGYNLISTITFYRFGFLILLKIKND